MSCQVKHCRGEAHVIYKGKPVCNKHWSDHCEKKIDLNKELMIG